MYERPQKTIINRKPDHTVLHVSRFGSTTRSNSEIMDVASSVKNEKHVTISNITRAHNFKEKAKEVNHYLLKLCMERNIYLIDPSET